MGDRHACKLDELALKRFRIPRVLDGERARLPRGRSTRPRDDRLTTGALSVLRSVRAREQRRRRLPPRATCNSAGVRVSLLLTAAEQTQGDVLNCSIAQKMGLAMNVVVATILPAAAGGARGVWRPTVVIDGCWHRHDRPPERRVMAKLVNAANSLRAGTPIVAADIRPPRCRQGCSGPGRKVHPSDVTVTFAVLRVGFLRPACGRTAGVCGRGGHHARRRPSRWN